MDAMVNLPVAKQFFQTRVGNAALGVWNSAWLGAAGITQKVMNRIPGKWDNKILMPVKKTMIWMDPVVEQRDRSGRKTLKIVDNPGLKGKLEFDLSGKLSLLSVTIVKHGVNIVRFNNAAISVKTARKEGWINIPKKGKVKQTHAHNLQNNPKWHHQILKVNPLSLNEKWIRKLDKLSPSELKSELNRILPDSFLR